MGPFTRAGCDVGAFSTANIVLERTPFDVAESSAPPSMETYTTEAKQTDDFIGAAIHCAIGSPFCTAANSAVPDLLPDEPDEYTGYRRCSGSSTSRPHSAA